MGDDLQAAVALTPETAAALADYLLGLADDELILAHRTSEWTGHAPILEEDIAFSNLALDELGHASLWYARCAELRGADPETLPDQLVFQRGPAEFRNVQMVELPNGDWAFSMLRQYLFDAAETARLERLASSRHTPTAETAAKIRQEERYHLRHTSAWVRRLGQGTDESNRRMQAALDSLFPFALQLFQSQQAQVGLAGEGLVPGGVEIQADWEAQVREHLEGSGLRLPASAAPPPASRMQHTEHLAELLAVLQEVARSDVQAAW
jgi:ring-1,2-phenylacetyl-CoA epoxidase subunit PaaC